MLTIKTIIYQRNHVAAQLRLQINRQLEILQQVKARLPSQLAEHALYCVIKQNKLLVYTDSATWASQLRFYAVAIRGAIESATCGNMRLVQIKVLNPHSYSTTTIHRNAIIPSSATINEIRSQIDLVSDPLLKKSLLKLSNTLLKLSKS